MLTCNCGRSVSILHRLLVELITEPTIDQEASVYIGSTDTVFTIKATSRFSPIRFIEISIDGKDFKLVPRSF